MMPFKRLDCDRLQVGDGADLARRCADLLREEATVQSVVRPHDFVIGPRSPKIRKRLAETINQTLGEGIERQRVETGGVAAMAARTHPRSEVGCGVALIADGKNVLRSWRATSPQTIAL